VAVFAVMADKDLTGIVQPLVATIAHWWVLPLTDVSRALSAQQTVLQLRAQGAVAESLSNADALQALVQSLRHDQRLIVFGSFYTVAAAMQVLAVN
jgi:dihydrofolate synthase/folylpolyglutamate synthase